jgi:hypothetical protein
MIRLLRTDELLLRALADITRELDTNESTRLHAVCSAGPTKLCLPEELAVPIVRDHQTTLVSEREAKRWM